MWPWGTNFEAQKNIKYEITKEYVCSECATCVTNNTHKENIKGSHVIKKLHRTESWTVFIAQEAPDASLVWDDDKQIQAHKCDDKLIKEHEYSNHDKIDF